MECRPGSQYTKLLVVSREIQVFFVRGFVGGGGQQSRMEGKVVWAVYVCDSVLCVRGQCVIWLSVCVRVCVMCMRVRVSVREDGRESERVEKQEKERERERARE